MQILYDYMAFAQLSQREFSRMLGISDTDLHNLLTFKRKMTVAQLVNIHRKTGLKVENLVWGCVPDPEREKEQCPPES